MLRTLLLTTLEVLIDLRLIHKVKVRNIPPLIFLIHLVEVLLLKDTVREVYHRLIVLSGEGRLHLLLQDVLPVDAFEEGMPLDLRHVLDAESFRGILFQEASHQRNCHLVQAGRVVDLLLMDHFVETGVLLVVEVGLRGVLL